MTISSFVAATVRSIAKCFSRSMRYIHHFATSCRCQRSSVPGVRQRSTASASAAGAGWRPRGRAGRTSSASDGEFVAGGPQVRAGARRFLAPCDRSIERARQPAVESAEAPHNTERGTRSLLRSRTAGLFYAFASGRPRIQWAGRAPGLCTLHALAYALGVARGKEGERLSVTFESLNGGP